MASFHPVKPGVSKEELPAICIKTWPDYDHEVQRKIVCAANRFTMADGSFLIIPASRHYSPIMRGLAKMLSEAGIIKTMMVCGDDQGFIDQFDDYHTREDAMIIAKSSGQAFDPERNGHNVELFSEGLY